MITILPTQKTLPSNCWSDRVDNILSLIESPTRNPNLSLILKARTIGKSSSEYNKLKAQCQHIAWNSVPGDNFEIKNINEYTGWIYIDIDDFGNRDIDEIKHKIFEFQFVKAVWKSFGGAGLGVLVSSPVLAGYENPSAFRQCYIAIGELFSTKIGKKVKVDTKCTNPNRINALSSDPDIYIRAENELEQFEFYYNPDVAYTSSVKSGQYTKITLNPDLYTDINLLNKYYNLRTSFYESFILADKESGMPVYYKEDLKLELDRYQINKHFGKDIISHYKLSNQSNTLAYSYTPFAGLKHMLYKGLTFPYKRRARTIMAITLNLMTIEKIQGRIIGLNEIFNIIHVLNFRCVDNKCSEGATPDFMPLDNEELNLLATKIYNTFNSEEYTPKFLPIKTIRTDDFLLQWSYDNPKYTGSYRTSAIVLREINQLKSKNNNDIWMKRIFDLYEMYPDIRTTDLILIISEDFSVSKSYAEKLISKFKNNDCSKKFHTPIYYLNDNINQQCGNNDTFSSKVFYIENDIDLGKIDSNRMYPDLRKKTLSAHKTESFRKIEELLESEWCSGDKITQENVKTKLGISISSVKRAWSEFKSIVKSHNDSLKPVIIRTRARLLLEFDF